MLQTQTHSTGCDHVRPLALFSLLAMLHNDGSGAVAIKLEQEDMCAHVCANVCNNITKVKFL